MRLIIKPMGVLLLVIIIGALGTMAILLSDRTVAGGSQKSLPLPAAPSPAASQQPQMPVPTGVEVFRADKLRLVGGDMATMTTIPVPEKPGGNESALRVVIKKVPKDGYAIQLTEDASNPLPRATPLSVRFWGRSTNKNSLYLLIEQSGSPFAKALSKQVILGKTWQEYAYNVTVPESFPKNPAVRFHIGFQLGTIELAGVRVVRADK